jgi:hypothetical protein
VTRAKLELPPRPPPEAFEGASPALVAYVEALEKALREQLTAIEEPRKPLATDGAVPARACLRG